MTGAAPVALPAAVRRELSVWLSSYLRPRNGTVRAVRESGAGHLLVLVDVADRDGWRTLALDVAYRRDGVRSVVVLGRPRDSWLEVSLPIVADW